MSIENHVVNITRDPNSIDELINFQATILAVIAKDDFNNVRKSIIKNNDKYIRNNIDITSFYTKFEKTITSTASILVCSNKNIHIVTICGYT